MYRSHPSPSASPPANTQLPSSPTIVPPAKNRSISTLSRSTAAATHQPLPQSLFHPVMHRTHSSCITKPRQSASQPASQSINQSLNHSITQSLNHSISRYLLPSPPTDNQLSSTHLLNQFGIPPTRLANPSPNRLQCTKITSIAFPSLAPCASC
jgi:hypothetical protein